MGIALKQLCQNDNDNRDSTERHNSRFFFFFFLQSPHYTANCLKHNHYGHRAKRVIGSFMDLKSCTLITNISLDSLSVEL